MSKAPKQIHDIFAQMNQIYVRETVNGKVGNYCLAELPTDKAIYHVVRLVLDILERETL